MKYLFIFDIDGTLIDSNESHARAWQHAFEIFGKRITISRIRAQIGKGADQLLPEFLTPKELRRIGEEIAELRGAIFKTRFLSGVKPFPKVRALFRNVRLRGGKIALASSSKEQEVKRFIKLARIENLVDQYTSSDDAQSSKPEPDIIMAVIRKFKHPRKEKILMVGDSPFDAVAARKAGIKVVGLRCGGFATKVLIRNGCEMVLDHPGHLLKEMDAVMRLFPQLP